MLIEEGVSLKDLSSMKIGGKARFLASISEVERLPEAFTALRDKGFPIVILGEGSNTVFGDGVLDISVIKIVNKGIKVLDENSESVTVEIQSGENWDDVVSWSVSKGFSGIEALSMIPGTAGTTPVQNVGAYGQEIAETLIEVRGYDRKNKTWKVLSKDECRFSYRSSIFKERLKGDFVITSIALSLSKKLPKIPDYHSLNSFFKGRREGDVSVSDIRNAVMKVRAKRLPDPSVIPNSGSFFKNPIVREEEASRLLKDFPNMPYFDVGDGKIKIFAGWLIENSGFKVGIDSKLSLFPGNALVVVNSGGASFEDLRGFAFDIKGAVLDKFGIELEVEPNMITH